jgi:hypothetical protein
MSLTRFSLGVILDKPLVEENHLRGSFDGMPRSVATYPLSAATPTWFGREHGRNKGISNDYRAILPISCGFRDRY